MNRRIKSFTLIEMIVVMLLSSIIIAIAYQGYILFYRQFLSFRHRADINSKIALMDSRMFSDFADCREIRKSNTGLIFVFKDKQITYSLEDTVIIRRQGAVTDSFYFKSPVINLNFAGRHVAEKDLVDEIIIETKLGEEEAVFRYFKRYGADVIINNTKIQ